MHRCFIWTAKYLSLPPKLYLLLSPSLSLVLYGLHLMAGIRYNILIWYRPLCDVVGDIHSAASFDRNDRYNYGYIIIRQWNRCPINIPRLCETHFICQLCWQSQHSGMGLFLIVLGFSRIILSPDKHQALCWQNMVHDWWYDHKLSLILTGRLINFFVINILIIVFIKALTRMSSLKTECYQRQFVQMLATMHH